MEVYAGLSEVSGTGRYVFFTVNLLERKLDLLVRHINDLREAVRATKRERPFHIDAWVVLPDHMHCVWTLPVGDDDFSNRWKAIKIRFVQALPRTERRSKVRIAKGERGIWQRRYWEHLIRDERDYARHTDYIHYNPVKHSYVKRASEWPHSSIHRYIARGVVDRNWGTSDLLNDKGGFGEPTSVGANAMNPNII